jgi:hypothetical protein
MHRTSQTWAWVFILKSNFNERGEAEIGFEICIEILFGLVLPCLEGFFFDGEIEVLRLTLEVVGNTDLEFSE